MKTALTILAAIFSLSTTAHAKEVAHRCSSLSVYAEEGIEKLPETSITIYKDDTVRILAAGQQQWLYAHETQTPRINQIPQIMASFGERVSAKQVMSAKAFRLCTESSQCARDEIPRRYLEVTLKSGQKKAFFYWNGEAMKCGSTRI